MIARFNLQQNKFARLLFGLAASMCLLMSTSSHQNLHASPFETPVVVDCRPVPAWADLVYISIRHGERDDAGMIPAEIYVADSNSSNTLRLSFSLFAYIHVAVSPGRDLIAAGLIIEDTNGNGSYEAADVKRLCVINPATGEQTDLAGEYDATWGGIVWSPDGNFLYASMTRDYLTWNIYRIRLSDGSVESMTDGLNAQLGVPGIRHWVSDVSVSPDGEWLTGIFAHPEETGFYKKMRIIEFRSDGTSARFLTDGGELSPGQYGLFPAGDFDPEFSPDLSKVVFARVTGVGFNGPLATSDIVTVSRDDLTIENLSGAGNPASHGIPNWSHDGRIVFTEWRAADPLYSGPMILSVLGQPPVRYWPAVGGTHARWIPPSQTVTSHWSLY